jgi:putative hydrolase of HD superfamily
VSGDDPAEEADGGGSAGASDGGDASEADPLPGVPDDAGDALAALAESYALKDERRTGWQLRGVDDPESVAAHSWGVSLLCLAFADEAGVDPDRALRQAVVHDLAEARVGDVPTRADPADEPLPADETERRERAAIADLAAPFPAVATAWDVYERRDSPEARFVKDMDLIDMCLQALVYERGGRYDTEDVPDSETGSDYEALDEFFATAEPRLSTDVGRRLFVRIRERYERARAGE